MKIELITQPMMGTKRVRLSDRLAEHVTSLEANELSVAAAYATVEGVSTVLEAFGGRPLKSSRWLLGLDDAITQPGAIQLLQSLPNSSVRVAAFASKGARFHTKMLHLANSKISSKAVLVVGSANMSRAAFERNAEAAAFVRATTSTHAEQLRETFASVWALGHSPTVAELKVYSTKYEVAREGRKQVELAISGKDKTTNVVSEPDEAQIDPSVADVCWIECGRVTLMGRELELKGTQARFFGLRPTGGSGEVLSLILEDGSAHPTQFIFRQKNHMWRVYFPTSIPRVREGLRPVELDGSLGRSPFVAVFERTSSKKRFRLSFLDESDPEYARLVRVSQKYGAFGDTGRRRFGWR